jgi:membrane protein
MSVVERAKYYAKHLYTRFKDDDVPSIGAQLTYYLLLSFFPFLIFLVTVIGFFQMSGDSVLSQFIRMLPSDTGQSVRETLTEVTANRSSAILSFGMIGTLWAASNGINAIIKGLNKAYDEQETRPFWKIRALSVVATIVLAVVIVVSMLLLVFGEIMGEYVFRFLGFPQGFGLIWNLIQFAVPVIAMFSVFLLLYRATPDRRLTWKEVVPGALFATFGWIGSSVLFSLYVNHFGNYTKTYGSLGGIIVLLIWLYWSSIIIIVGGELNATLAFDREGRVKETAQARRYTLNLPSYRDSGGTARS